MSVLGIAWMAVGTVLVLLGPGWAWSYAIFPHSRPLQAARTRARELDAVERAAVALALSLALVPLGAILWSNLLRLPLSTPGAIAYLVLLSAAGLALARFAPSVLGVRPDHVGEQANEDQLDAEEEEDAGRDQAP